MHDYSRPLGHSNASLFASADEMAGTYSPQGDNQEFTPARNTHFTPARNTPASRPQHSRCVPPTNHPRIDTQNMELHYPMPDKAVVWHQAEHPDTIPKRLNYEGDISLEAFPGASQILSHANPEQFLMPLKSRVICMKVDKLIDMKYCLANGAVTNLPSCNERIMDCWDHRDGERVFMMFSISGQKEFCAMAEMISPVGPGSLPGWTKPGCTGIISITFIFVKDVPFTLINHIKHKANGQPVANMWNSMMYHDNTGYHVAKIFCEHPVLSSVLVTFRAEQRSNYTTQLRIPTSGITSYSASSYSSTNRKTNDPRSATRVHIHRSGDRNQWSSANGDAAQSQSWRRNDAPPPPSDQPQIGNTPTQVATHRRGMLQHDSKVAALPPHFSLARNHHASAAGAINSARSFTTADDRMLAEFAESRGAKRSDTGSSNSDREVDQQTNNAHVGPNSYRGGFQEGRASRALQRRTPPPPVNSNWRGTDMSARRGYVQWQKDGRAAQVPVFTEDSPPGLGIHSAYKYAGDHQPWRSATMPFHLPSPAASSQPSKGGSSPQADELRRQTEQNLPAQSSSPFHGFAQNRTRPAARLHRTFPGRITNHSIENQQYLINPGNPMIHSHSMPAMVHQVTQRFSAQHLRAQAEAFEPGHLEREVNSRPSVQDWVIETPVRAAFEINQSPSSMSGEGLSLANTTVATPEYSPDKLTADTSHLNMEQKLKWHKARVDMLEVEVDMTGSTPNKEAVLKWLKAKVRILEINIIGAHNAHEAARGDLAQPTDDHPPQSPKYEHHSEDWPKRANGSSVESELIAPEVDDDGKIVRSVSRNRADKYTHIGQKLRHRRANFATEEFSGSFDARLHANVDDLLASPTPSGRHPVLLPGHTHAHPPQVRPSTGLAHGHSAAAAAADHIDSCTEGRYQQDHLYCGHDAHDINTSANLGEEDPFISPRGRRHLNTQSPSTRDASQRSYNSGIWLEDEGGSGYP